MLVSSPHDILVAVLVDDGLPTQLQVNIVVLVQNASLVAFEHVVVVVEIIYVAISSVGVAVIVRNALAAQVSIEVAVLVVNAPGSAVGGLVRVLVDDLAAWAFDFYPVAVVVEQVAFVVELIAVGTDDVLGIKRKDKSKRQRTIE